MAEPSARSDAAEISVTGVGTSTGPANVATITVGVSVLADRIGEATAAAATAAERVIEAVVAQGVERQTLQTADYSVHPEHDHRGNRPRLVGYRVTNTLRVIVTDLAQLSSVVERATDAGGDTAVVHGLGFGRTTTDADRGEAREAAWNDAVAKADQFAALAGVQRGSALQIVEGGSASGRPGRQSRSMMMAESAPPLEGGELSQTVSISVTFATTPLS